jgi:hypothetical protein
VRTVHPPESRRTIALIVPLTPKAQPMRRSVLAAALLAVAGPALAQPGPWGGWGGYGMGSRFGEPAYRANRGPAEGKVEVSTFVNSDAGLPALGSGKIGVVAMPGATPTADAREQATYEAAVLDALAGHGYDTISRGDDSPQTVELQVTHTVAVPEEAPHKPVSGAMETTVSNRGTGFGLALAVDLSKPAKALISTRLEARIRDRASGKVLWEGRADMLSREGSEKWTDQAIATRLAKALLARFPEATG